MREACVTRCSYTIINRSSLTGEGEMKDVRVDAEGHLHCPKCGGTSFDMARTGKAKVSGFLTVGVGVILLPKRMKCLQCGTWSKSGNAKPLPLTSNVVAGAKPSAARTAAPSQA